MQKAITMHHHRHTAAVMESEQTAVTSAFLFVGIKNQIAPRIIMSSSLTEWGPDIQVDNRIV